MSAPILTNNTQQLDCGSDWLSPELPARFLVCLTEPEINERRLRAREPHALRSGDLIRVGEAAPKYLERGDIEARYHGAVFRLMGVDALTQLKNRRFLLDQLDREIARSGRHERTLSIVLVEVDRFKGINDFHGHFAGDAVLQQIGVTLGRATRREDCVGRLGGDRVPGAAPGNAAARRAALRRAPVRERRWQRVPS
jgi:diguanylate cyclase (GGDEF)-like protein